MIFHDMDDIHYSFRSRTFVQKSVQFDVKTPCVYYAEVSRMIYNQHTVYRGNRLRIESPGVPTKSAEDLLTNLILKMVHSVEAFRLLLIDTESENGFYAPKDWGSKDVDVDHGYGISIRREKAIRSV